jgi:hypothetical protein
MEVDQDLTEVWDIFSPDWLASWKWRVILSDSKVYSCQKTIPWGGKSFYYIYLWIVTISTTWRAKKLQNSALRKKPWINQYFCVSSTNLDLKNKHNSVTNISTNTTWCEKYKCYIHICLDQTIKHKQHQTLTCFSVLVIYITASWTYPKTTLGQDWCHKEFIRLLAP